VAGADHRVAELESGVGGLGDGPREIDSADAGKAPDDPAGAGRSKGVLVVDARIRDPHDQLAAVQVVEPHLLETSCGLLVDFADAIGLEPIHDPPRRLYRATTPVRASPPPDRPSIASRPGGSRCGRTRTPWRAAARRPDPPRCGAASPERFPPRR